MMQVYEERRWSLNKVKDRVGVLYFSLERLSLSMSKILKDNETQC